MKKLIKIKNRKNFVKKKENKKGIKSNHFIQSEIWK